MYIMDKFLNISASTRTTSSATHSQPSSRNPETMSSQKKEQGEKPITGGHVSRLSLGLLIGDDMTPPNLSLTRSLSSSLPYAQIQAMEEAQEVSRFMLPAFDRSLNLIHAFINATLALQFRKNRGI